MGRDYIIVASKIVLPRENSCYSRGNMGQCFNSGGWYFCQIIDVENIECSRNFIKTPRDHQCRTVACRWNLTIVQHVDYLNSSTTFQWGCCRWFQIIDIFQIFFQIFDNILCHRRPHHSVRKTWEFQSICFHNVGSLKFLVLNNLPTFWIQSIGTK